MTNVGKPHFVLSNVGLKMIGGIQNIPKADLYIDARAFPDEAKMRAKDIPSDKKVSVVESLAPGAVTGVLQMVREAIKHIPERRYDVADPYKAPFRIMVFCAFGINRSVAVKGIIAKYLQTRGFDVDVRPPNEGFVKSHASLS